MVLEIFSLPTLVSSACVACCRVLMPDIGSSSSQPLNPGRNYFLLQALNVGLHVKTEDLWEDEWKHNITISTNHCIHHNLDWVFGFHQYESVLTVTPKHSEIFILEPLAWMLSSTACCFQISGEVNCIIITAFLTVPNWLCYLSLRPTNARIWHKAVFKVGPVAGPKPTRVRQGQKYLRPRRHSLFWGASGARQ